MIRVITLLSSLFFALPVAADTPLHAAAKGNDYAAALSLIAGGADVNTADEYGDTPLHKAAEHDAREVAALLIDKGANVNAANAFGAAPLHYAAAADAHTIALLLIVAAADVNALNEHERTPLHWAARANAGEVADLLVDEGADVNAVSGWFWFYGRAAGRDAWRRGKGWFDAAMRGFAALEEEVMKKKVAERTQAVEREKKQAESEALSNSIISGVVGCARSGNAAGCSRAAVNSLGNLATAAQQIKQWQRGQLARIRQWEQAFAQTLTGAPSHNVRFVVPPGEQSRPVRVLGVQPFARYVARLSSTGGFCTAFLVRPKIAMTNSHCVCDDARCTRKKRPGDIRLTFARQDLSGDHDIVARVKKVYYTDHSAGYHNDYAFLVLAEAPELGGHLEVASDTRGVRFIATAGYPGDLFGGEVMTALWGCRLRSRSKVLFFSEDDCHNYRGASGSPYIAVDGAHRGKVVGINAFGRLDTTTSGGGPSVSSFYRRLQHVIRTEER